MELKKLACFVFCHLAFTTAVKAQNAPLLTLKDAVEIALKNNYNIKLAKNDSTITKNNVTRGNAGFLPVVNGNLTSTNSIQNTTTSRINIPTTSFHNSHNTNIVYGVGLNWTIFNGFAMFANYDQLKALNKLSGITSRDTVVQTIASVIGTYYNLVNQNEILLSLKGAMRISKTQLSYASDKFRVGTASGLDVLNAQVNVNTDTANYLIQLQQFKATKIQLNQLLVRDLRTDFSVADTIMVDDKLILADIINNADTQNPRILSTQISRQLAEINLRQVKATRYPQVGVNTAYNFSNSASPSGALLSQEAHGLNYGLTATINIFNGFNQSRRETNAKIQIDNSEIIAKQIRLGIEAQINSLFVSYLSGLDLTKIGQDNIAVAKHNLDISLEKYRLGNITPLEIRQAQENYIDAQVKFFAAQYQAKAAEVTLKQITNNINIQ